MRKPSTTRDDGRLQVGALCSPGMEDSTSLSRKHSTRRRPGSPRSTNLWSVCSPATAPMHRTPATSPPSTGALPVDMLCGAFHTRTCRPWASGPALPTALDPPLGIRGGGDRRTTTRVGRHRERPRAVLRTRKEMPMSDATPEPQSEAMQSLATWNPIHGIWESPQLDLFGQRGPWSTTWWTCTMTRKAWPTRFRDRRTSPAVPSFHHARRRPGRGEPAGAAAYRPQRFNSPPLTPRVTTTNPSTLHHGTRQLDGPNRTAVHTNHRANHRSHGNGGGLS